MDTTRLLKLSIVYAIKDKLHENEINTESSVEDTTGWLYCPVLDSFPKDFSEVNLPTVIVEDSFALEGYEQIGGGYKSEQVLDIDIYSRYNGQRDDLTDLVLEVFKSQVALGDYNVGFPTYTWGGSSFTRTGLPTRLQWVNFDDLRKLSLPEMNVGDTTANRKKITVEALILT